MLSRHDGDKKKRNKARPGTQHLSLPSAGTQYLSITVPVQVLLKDVEHRRKLTENQNAIALFVGGGAGCFGKKCADVSVWRGCFGFCSGGIRVCVCAPGFSLPSLLEPLSAALGHVH